MNLDDLKKQKVAAWIEEGLKLSEIQSKLASELGLQLTYIEVRFLVNDLKLMPKDPPAPPPTSAKAGQPAAGDAAPPEPEPLEEPMPEEVPAAIPGAPGAGAVSVSVSVDRVARPGAMVSGSVTFSDGNVAGWYLDQMGRLGIVPQQTGYRPAPPELQAFQIELQKELQKLGF